MSKQLRVVVAKFKGDEYEEGGTAIRVIEIETTMNGLDAQWWCEEYNKTHKNNQIQSAKIESLDYLKDYWEYIN